MNTGIIAAVHIIKTDIFIVKVEEKHKKFSIVFRTFHDDLKFSEVN